MNQCPNAPSPGAGRANRGPWVFFVLLALGVLWGCAVPFGPDGIVSTVEQAAMSGQLVPVKTVTLVGGPRLNHPLHIENDLECSDCHEADAETGEPTMPTWETCTDCHEQPEEGEEPDEDEPVLVGTFFDAEHKPLWKKAIGAYAAEIKFRHKFHAKVAGEAGVASCTKCHGDMKSEEGGRVAGQPFTMGQCLECHQAAQAPATCETCHEQMRTTRPPPSHDRAWKHGHGNTANHLRLMATQNECSLCHVEPRDCNDCHRVTKPASHHQVWMKRHGQIVRAAGGDLPQQCAMCHQNRSYCENCHLDQAPRNHTTLWRTRTHGVMVGMNRQTCATCHHTPFCQRCHEDTAPRTHRGMWARTRSTHCVQCHFPLGLNDSCKVCHRRNPTHDTAPDQPIGHIPGRDCRFCHGSVPRGGAPVMRHLDNGMNCEFCHH